MAKNRKYFYTAIKMKDENNKNQKKTTMFKIDFMKKMIMTYTEGGLFLKEINFNNRTILNKYGK